MTDQNAGIRDGHQSLSVPGRLAHLFTISRPVPPRHCAQCLLHDGPPHSRQEVLTDPKTEIPFFWDTSSTWFPSRSLQLWIDITNQALICSFLLSQAGCAHTWQILLGLCVHRQMVPLGWLHTREAQHCISQHWDFNVLTRTCGYFFPPRRRKISNGGSLSTQCSEGSPSYPDRTRHSVVHGCIEHRLGSTLECIDRAGVWTTTEITLHINVLELEAIHRAMLHWLRKRMGLTVLVASDNSTVVSYINKQGGTWSIQLCRRNKKLLLMCQANQIVLWA